MNEIEWLVKQLKTRLPDLEIKVDEPNLPTGNHWLDAKRDKKHVIVQWRPGQGFGFFAEDADYSERPREVISEKEKALEKIIDFFQS